MFKPLSSHSGQETAGPHAVSKPGHGGRQVVLERNPPQSEEPRLQTETPHPQFNKLVVFEWLVLDGCRLDDTNLRERGTAAS